MITKALLVGKREFTSKKTSKGWQKLYFEVTSCVPGIQGTAVEQTLREATEPYSVGEEYVICIDNFGRITDVQ